MSIPNPSLPGIRQPLLDGDSASRPYYLFFQWAATNLPAVSARVDDLTTKVDAISSGGISQNANVTGSYSILTRGALAAGIVQVSLDGDVLAPGNTQYYGSGPDGAKGWYAVSSALAGSGNISLSTADSGVTTFDLTNLADSGEGELLAFTRDAKGRVSGTRPVTEADLPAITAIASTALGSPRLVAVANGQAYLPDLANPADMTRLAGFTDRSWAAGDTIRIVRTLIISEPAWSWSPGLVFAGTGGTFTQSPDPALALVQVGVAVDSTTLALRLSSPLLR